MAWHEVTGLYKVPLRKEWGVDCAYGTTGLTIHTVKFDPQRKNRIHISSSGAGLYRSDDLGESWRLIRNGLMEDCPVFKSAPRPSKPSTEQDDLRKHLETVHTCTHKITSAKGGTLYQQNHCGIFLSENSGDRWMDVSPDLKRRHGFPIAKAEKSKEYVFTVPAYQGICKRHN